MVKPDQERVRGLLTDTVLLLCRNGLNFQKNLTIQGLIAVTTDDSEIFVVQISDVMSTDTNIVAVEGPRKRPAETTGSFGQNKSLSSDNNASVKVETHEPLLNNDEISSAVTLYHADGLSDDGCDRLSDPLNNSPSKNVEETVSQENAVNSHCDVQSSYIVPTKSTETSLRSVKEEEEGCDDDDVIFVKNTTQNSNADVNQFSNPVVPSYHYSNTARVKKGRNIKKRQFSSISYTNEGNVHDESYETEPSNEYEDKYSAPAPYATGDNKGYDVDQYDDQQGNEGEDGAGVEIDEDGNTFSGAYSDVNFSEHSATSQFRSTARRFASANSNSKRFRNVSYSKCGDYTLDDSQYPDIAEQSASGYVESANNVAEWSGVADEEWGTSSGKGMVAGKSIQGRPRAGQVRALNPGHFTVQSKGYQRATANIDYHSTDQTTSSVHSSYHGANLIQASQSSTFSYPTSIGKNTPAAALYDASTDILDHKYQPKAKAAKQSPFSSPGGKWGTASDGGGSSFEEQEITITRFMCKLCQKSFNHRPSLLSHQISVHGRQKNKRGRPAVRVPGYEDDDNY